MAYGTDNAKVFRSHDIKQSMHSLVNATVTSTAATTGAHVAFNLGKVCSNLAMQVTIASTKSTKVNLQGSLDGSNWSNIAGSTWVIGTQVTGDIIYVTGKPVTHVRAYYVTKNSTKPLNAYIGAY